MKLDSVHLGIFAKTFPRPTLEATFQAVSSHGLNYVQFNMACAGLPTLPDRIDPDVCRRIRNAAGQFGVTIAAVSGTFNMIHPDLQQRRQGLQGLGILAAACREIGAPVITLCTGTRDPQDMWRRHPDNDAPEAWHDLVVSVREAIRIVDEFPVTLAIEPELANVIDSAIKARQLLDEIASPRLRIVLDAANLLHATNIDQMDTVFQQAFDLLGRDIVLAHAKDVRVDGQLQHVAAGTGVLDYDRYLRLLHSLDFQCPLILHGLLETEVSSCVAFLRNKLPRMFA